MHDDTQGRRESTRDLNKAQLTADEKRTGAVARRLAFHTLALIAVAACVLSVYWWYLWFVTVRVCLLTYGPQQQDSLLLTKGADHSWQEYFSALDISSFSALILALFFTRLAYSGIKNTLWKRYNDGEAYGDHAYHAVLFPPQFESLCIRFGLLGTLLSFLLAAVSQLSDLATEGHPDQAGAVTRIDEKGSQDPTATGDGTGPAVASARTGSLDGQEQIRTSEVSHDIFLLLCASLVSTFVGTFVAYVLIPPLNRLNDSAVGMHQHTPPDEEATADEFFRQLDRTSKRLGDFERATASLTAVATGVQRFEASAAEASEKLDNMLTLLDRATGSFEASNKHMRRIGQFSKELQKPLDKMFEAAARIENASVAGNRAFVDLQKAAKSAEEPVRLVARFSTSVWTVLKQVRDSLESLDRSEGDQSAAVTSMADSFTALNSMLGNLLEAVVTLIEQNQQDRAATIDARQKMVSLRQQLQRSATELQELKATTEKSQAADGRLHKRSPVARLPGQSRRRRSARRLKPWWRRWLGALAGVGGNHPRSDDTLDETESNGSYREESQP